MIRRNAVPLVLVALILVCLTLIACGQTTENGVAENVETTKAPGWIMVFYVDTENGPVECIFAKEGYGGGLSCNWGG